MKVKKRPPEKVSTGEMVGLWGMSGALRHTDSLCVIGVSTAALNRVRGRAGGRESGRCGGGEATGGGATDGG